MILPGRPAVPESAGAGSAPTVAPANAPDALPAFSELVQEHLDVVWRVLRRVGLSESDADDAAQQVFMLAERKLSQMEPGKERSFLYGTALRVAANFKRSMRRRREAPTPSPAEAVSAEVTPDRELELERARALLDELLCSMQPELRSVLVLAEMENLTLTEIAEHEAIPRGTAASRLRRARAQFRELLSNVQDRNPFGGEDP